MPTATRGRQPTANESSPNEPLESTVVTTSKAHDGFLTLRLPKNKFQAWVEANEHESIQSARLPEFNTPGEPFLTLKVSAKDEKKEPLPGPNQSAVRAVLVDKNHGQGENEVEVSPRNLEHRQAKSGSPLPEAHVQLSAGVSDSVRAELQTLQTSGTASDTLGDPSYLHSSEAGTVQRQLVTFKLPSRSSRLSLLAPAVSPITPGFSPVTPEQSPIIFTEADGNQSSTAPSEISKVLVDHESTTSTQVPGSAAFEPTASLSEPIVDQASSNNNGRRISEAKLRSDERVNNTASPIQQSIVATLIPSNTEAARAEGQDEESLKNPDTTALREEDYRPSFRVGIIGHSPVAEETVTPEPQPADPQTFLTPSRRSERNQIPKRTPKRKPSSTPLQESPPKRHTRQNSRADIVTSGISNCFTTLRVRPGYDPATMAPGTVIASDSLKDVIQNLYDIQSQTYGFRPETQPVLINQIEELTHSLAKLQDLADPITHPNSSLHELFVAPEIIDYVDDGRNPDIYGRDFIETVQRGNAVLNGKKQAFKDFGVVFAQMLKEGIGGVDKQVDRVMEHAGMADELETAEMEKAQTQESATENGDTKAI